MPDDKTKPPVPDSQETPAAEPADVEESGGGYGNNAGPQGDGA